MTSTQYFSNYVKKLSHPIREIRERSLQLLVAKLRLGWEIDDELSGARELLEALLAWFHAQKPTLQREALQLLLSTITNLLILSDTGKSGRPSEVLTVLLCITRSLCKRILELSSIDLSNDSNKVPDGKESEDGVNLELRELAGDSSPDLQWQDETLAALRQWPAPLYALETLHSVLTTMARSIILVDAEDQSEVLDMKTLNICLSLVESLIQLLLDCVSERFWAVDHVSKTHRDIAHKSCMVMRLLGDLLMKYKGCRPNYIPGLNSTSSELLADYEAMYCSDPFSEETIQAGEELMSELSASRREKWCELVVDTDMTHNSKKAWSNLRKLTGDPPPAANPGQVSANQVASQLLLNGKPAGRLRRTHLESSCSRGGTGDLSKPFTLQEFDCAMESLKNGKAAGVDDLTVHLHSETSRWRSQKNGLPQGSVLAPTLFNIYTNDQPAPPNTQRFLYADDLALAAQSGTFGDVEGTLSAALETLSQYYEQNCLRPNPAKTQSCAFHLRNRDASRPLDVTWGGVRIEHCPHPRYLGITLDRTLTYKSHCANTQHKVISRNNLLRRLTSTNWGANAHTLRTTGLALSFSAGEYACPVWHRSAHAKLVTSALNDTCRMVTGCLRPTPLNQLYPLAGIAPPEIRREVACSIEKRKQEQDPRHPLKSFTEYPDKTHHRVAWFRLASSAEKLMYWARHSALPPSSLIVALQAALLDPALELFYPTLNNNIQDVFKYSESGDS
ncbi:LOW QUALITY PROTEIN: hypothetical protein MSG28_003373 [Choristoneura fumiferana]|uniref:Uncharacterized protein n=1 Tax=Choristoneura fumiferana TaxID=7141 RepID=A0ACC0KEZ3_CHOFU|nr:LOW QUALITY PROTEIN: hypothetical protein MSG28_003373 [Choristoneura fumiferana]